ncbi:MAG: hypothetical protein ACRCY5_05355 [Phocaeicola sp.]
MPKSVTPQPSGNSEATEKEKQVDRPIKCLPKPYTVQTTPFLKSECKVDYSQLLHVTYSLIDSIGTAFPIIRAPRKGSPIKFPVKGRNGKRGACEESFCRVIVENELGNKFYDNLTLLVAGYQYEPDLAYIDANKGIFIDIEIDEPYAGWEKIPIHYKTLYGTIDDRRNTLFTERGWTVIRFSENQIHNQPLSCLKEIFQLIRKIDDTIVIPASVQNQPDLKSEDMWTKENAEEKIINKEREKLLNISEFKIPNNERYTVILEDYEEGIEVEKEVITKRDDEAWRIHSISKTYKEYINNNPHGKYIEKANSAIDEELWEDCIQTKKYTKYLNTSVTGTHKEKAIKLHNEQLTIERREQVKKIMLENKLREDEIEREKDRKKKEQLEAQKKKELADQYKKKREEEERQEKEKQARATVTTSIPPASTSSARGYA